MIAERIQEYVRKLPHSLQAEVLDFIEYLLAKAEREALRREEREWVTLSLAFAMRGMEDEDTPTYTIADLKVVFSWKRQGKSSYFGFHKLIWQKANFALHPCWTDFQGNMMTG